MRKLRLTLDMSAQDHMYLKMMSAKLGVSMKDFAINAINKQIEDLEDEYWNERADNILKEIDERKSEFVNWDDVKDEIA